MYESPFIMYESPFIFSLVDEVAKEVAEGIDDFVMKATVNAGITVDKDELVKALAYDRGQYDKGYSDGYQDGKRDAMEVVRCKDCKYWNPYKSHHYKGHFCDVVTLFVQENEYCAWGKRREEGADDAE